MKINISREPAGTLAHSVKELPFDEVKEVIDLFDYDTLPMEHQSRAIYLGIDQDNWLYALDMGTGKSLIALYLIIAHKYLGNRGRTLITCPPTVVRQWRKEILKHTSLTYSIIEGKDSNKKFEDFCSCNADITVVSHSWLTLLFTAAQTKPDVREKLVSLSKDYDILVIDEAHSIKNSKTKGFKGYKKHLIGIEKKYMLTGTPIGNQATGLWALYYILDKGETFGTSYNRFLSTYFTSHDKGRYITYKEKASTREEMRMKFWSKAIRWEEKECSDLPDKTFSQIPLYLSPEQETAYDALLQEAVDEEKDVGDFEFSLMKITAGIGMKISPKLDALKELITEICVDNGRQFIVWVWLRDEHDYLLGNLRKAFKKLKIESVKGSDVNKDKVLEEWALHNVDVLICNQKTLGVGLDLYEASHCCYWSNNRSVIDRKQSEKRIHRTGQLNHCFYYDLIVEDTIDEVNLSIVNKAKGGFAKMTKDSDLFEVLRKQRENSKKAKMFAGIK